MNLKGRKYIKMKINADQVFIIGDHELESRIGNQIAIKFNEIFDSKTSIYLDSAFTGLNPYKFVALYGDPGDDGYYCIKEIYSNTPAAAIEEKIIINDVDFNLIFINMGRLVKSNIAHYDKMTKMLEQYRIKSR